MKLELTTAIWKYAKRWTYSITYDEALSDLYKFVVPVHDALGIPGHVEVVAGQIGQLRNISNSSYNGMKHMDAAELRDIMSRGWGVGAHSWSHEIVMDNPERELRKAKAAIESAIGRRVTIYTAPGSNANLTSEVIEKAKEYGYIAGASITDNLNLPDSEDLFWISRPPLHEKFSDLYDSAFDPYKRIQQSKQLQGWLVDYLHCPLEKAIHDYKDCTAAHHKERMETVAEEGRYDCWFANPDDVVDYRYMRRASSVEQCAGTWGKFIVHIRDLPEQVMSRELTFVLKSAYIPEAMDISVDGNSVQAFPNCGSGICFTAQVHDKSEIVIHRKIQEATGN